jgi:hypothetical protein
MTIEVTSNFLQAYKIDVASRIALAYSDQELTKKYAQMLEQLGDAHYFFPSVRDIHHLKDQSGTIYLTAKPEGIYREIELADSLNDTANVLALANKLLAEYEKTYFFYCYSEGGYHYGDLAIDKIVKYQPPKDDFVIPTMNFSDSKQVMTFCLDAIKKYDTNNLLLVISDKGFSYDTMADGQSFSRPVLLYALKEKKGEASSLVSYLQEDIKKNFKDEITDNHSDDPAEASWSIAPIKKENSGVYRFIFEKDSRGNYRLKAIDNHIYQAKGKYAEPEFCGD